MKKMTYFSAIVASFLLIGVSLVVSCRCYAEDKIVWQRANFPPAFIVQGEDKEKGYCDRMVKDVTEFMKEYKHDFTESTYKRIVESLKEEKNVCCGSIYKTPEREKFAVYSEPLFIGLSNGVIIPKEKLTLYKKHITPDKLMDIKSLLSQENSIKIGVISGRNYGPIEEAITPFRKTDRIYERAADDSKGLVEMLIDNRIDIILALPMEISYITKQLGIKDKVAFLPVKDGEQYTVSYMACSGNELGRKAIEKINVVIKEKRPVFAKYYKDWLDESSAETYNTLVEKVFGFLPAK